MRIDRGTMCRWMEDAGATAGATVVDDLSFGHETGAVQHDDKCVAHVLALGVRYVGYAELQEINGAAWYDPQRIRDYVEQQGQDPDQAAVPSSAGA